MKKREEKKHRQIYINILILVTDFIQSAFPRCNGPTRWTTIININTNILLRRRVGHVEKKREINIPRYNVIMLSCRLYTRAKINFNVISWYKKKLYSNSNNKTRSSAACIYLSSALCTYYTFIQNWLQQRWPVKEKKWQLCPAWQGMSG